MDYPLGSSPRLESGIQYESLLPGLVSEYEEREAARWGGYTWPAWQALEREERIDGIAHYRLDRLISLHQLDAQEADRKRRESMEAAKRGR